MSVALTSEQKESLRDETQTAKRISAMFGSLVSNIDEKCSFHFIQNDEPNNAPAGALWYKPDDKELRFKTNNGWFLCDSPEVKEW